MSKIPFDNLCFQKIFYKFRAYEFSISFNWEKSIKLKLESVKLEAVSSLQLMER